MQRHTDLVAHERLLCFNPHPIIRPDAAWLKSLISHSSPSFNPHPIIRPDAAMSGRWMRICVHVSILIRSSDRMQQQRTVKRGLSRPEFQSSSDHQTGCSPTSSVLSVVQDWFQSSSDHQTGCSVTNGVGQSAPTQFQSSSDHQTGCSFKASMDQRSPNEFQSSSDHQTGCSATGKIELMFSTVNVSILIRSSDRMQHPWAPAIQSRIRRFNPHPIIRPDAASRPGIHTALPCGFNPHPIIRPDAACIR